MTEFGKVAMAGEYARRTSMYVACTSLPCYTLSAQAEYTPRTRQTWDFCVLVFGLGLVVLVHVGPYGYFYGWAVVICWTFLGKGPRKELGLIWKIGPYLGLRCLFWDLGPLVI